MKRIGVILITVTIAALLLLVTVEHATKPKAESSIFVPELESELNLGKQETKLCRVLIIKNSKGEAVYRTTLPFEKTEFKWPALPAAGIYTVTTGVSDDGGQTIKVSCSSTVGCRWVRIRKDPLAEVCASAAVPSGVGVSATILLCEKE